MYIPVCVYLSVGVYICVHVCTSVCGVCLLYMCVRVLHVSACMYMCIVRACGQVFACVYVYVYVYEYIYACVYTCVVCFSMNE